MLENVLELQKNTSSALETMYATKKSSKHTERLHIAQRCAWLKVRFLKNKRTSRAIVFDHDVCHMTPYALNAVHWFVFRHKFTRNQVFYLFPPAERAIHMSCEIKLLTMSKYQRTRRYCCCVAPNTSIDPKQGSVLFVPRAIDQFPSIPNSFVHCSCLATSVLLTVGRASCITFSKSRHDTSSRRMRSGGRSASWCSSARGCPGEHGT